VRVLWSLRTEHLVSGTSWRLLVVMGPGWAAPQGPEQRAHLSQLHRDHFTIFPEKYC
jgi:hypothetical protein